MSKFALVSGKVLDPSANLDAELDILIEDGLIAAVDKPGSFTGIDNVDVSGKLVTPGLIDIHVHLREPGEEWKETVETGCLSAVAGGFSAVCCMPNTQPAIDTASVVELILEQAEKANLCRVYPIGAISVAREGKAMSPMVELKEAGCVAFSDDGSPVSDAGLMRRALEYSSMLGTVLTVHEEVLSLSHACAMNESPLSLKLGLNGMPAAAEEIMIARDIELARLTGGRVHFCHVSTGRGAELIRRAKHEGINVTGETAPHYLVLDESYVSDYNTNYKMSMPLRTPEDNRLLAEALEEGVIDCIATDHAPHDFDSKNKPFAEAAFGILGLQTAVPLTLAKVREGKLSLARAVDALTAAPRRCFNLENITIAKGSVADITVIDLEKKYIFTEEMNKSKSKNSPFIGAELQGKAVKTFVGGKEVYSE